MVYRLFQKFHRSVAVHPCVRAHRTQIRLLFLPARSPELNLDELGIKIVTAQNRNVRGAASVHH
ncbi:MAG: hypothetical protein EKK71_13705 [Candidatus Competibacteraceae bacterium]|nr:MAG: hypothetical protein EKK71_13705 [Candidatus Competibacteraceae bacterium]